MIVATLFAIVASCGPCPDHPCLNNGIPLHGKCPVTLVEAVGKPIDPTMPIQWLPTKDAKTSGGEQITLIVPYNGGGEVAVCSADPNRADLTICIEGADRRIRLFLPYSPCGTPEANSAQCVEWKIGKPW